MKPFSIAGIQMPVLAIVGIIPLMKIKLDVLMNVFHWVQMVIFNELCALASFKINAVAFPNKIQSDFQELLKTCRKWLIPGSFIQLVKRKTYSTTMIINPQREIVVPCSKMYPFYSYKEGMNVKSEFLIWNILCVARFRVSICYDMWFPEISRTMSINGLDVIINPTFTWNLERDKELAIVKATSDINQCYIIDVNGLEAQGIDRSLFCDPDKKGLRQAGPTAKHTYRG